MFFKSLKSGSIGLTSLDPNVNDNLRKIQRKGKKTIAKPFGNDQPEGQPDNLGIETQVNAIADMLVMKQTPSPFVIGITGEWGSGKSFCTELMLRRFEQIMINDVTDVDKRNKSPFVGHIYPIRFSALTYSKKDIWPSLMYRIFKDLNDQLSLENDVYVETDEQKKERLRKGFFPFKVVKEVPKDRRGILRGVDDDKFKIWEDKTEKQGIVSASFQEFVKENFKNDMMQIKRLQKGIEMNTKYIELNALTDGRRKKLKKYFANVDDEMKILLEKEFNTIKQSNNSKKNQIEKDEKLEEKLKKLEMYKNGSNSFGDEALENLEAEINEVNIKILKIEFPPTIEDLLEQVITLQKLYVYLKSMTVDHKIMLIAVLVFCVALFVALYFLISDLSPGFTGLISGCPLLVGITTVIRKAFIYGENRTVKLFNDLEVYTFDDIENYGSIDGMSQKQHDIDKNKVMLEKLLSRVPVAQGQSLHDIIISRLESSEYEMSLGVVHQAQKDLKRLSDSLWSLSDREEEMRFPRGKPRIVLFIDDLDRCDCKTVSQVIEALELLLKFDLFVAVVSMDLRYVTSSLERYHNQILTHGTAISGLRFIEKIIQIFYNVPKMRQSAIKDHIEGKVVIEEKEEKEKEKKGDGDKILDDDISYDESYNEEAKEINEMRTLFETDKGEKSTIDQNPILEMKIIVFTPEDISYIEEACKFSNIKPSSINRLINISKILKRTWQIDEEPEKDVKNVIYHLLALSANHPGVMSKALYKMEEYLDGRENEKGDTSSASDASVWSVIKNNTEHLIIGSKLPPDPIKESPISKLRVKDIGIGNIRTVISFSSASDLIIKETVKR